MSRKPETPEFLPREEKFRKIRWMADYQFGRGAGKVLFPDTCKFIVSPKTGRIRQITDKGIRIATLKASSGWFSLSIEGAKRIKDFFEYPRNRVVVTNEVSEFIADGKNVFAKHVVDVDENLRAGDEVVVVDEDDNLLATGKAVLCASEMMLFNRGIAVNVRAGVKKYLDQV
ncbi:Prefoldin, molecular chaperone implicated in de novo protein folding, alpha subunit [Archaeoglobus sulfaticallidus PM70-1]|uniref:Prefoldin, molecular chaperone implicated in de novo protein folding, alpha subunit n=1 Tax=Archaeoglobus sulfaticallidus PM70-1 TaxID=387631 RepID=N0BKJ7_9EURY|nr:PUA domain-containing protein [Archaeoglobus sulfaticallidus]AGK60725.1 Prefoldin, molecular chaperone implicated in de novo protein folding, alpha subunit [Archaeoglobus sulfaticallidus PM70-1]